MKAIPLKGMSNLKRAKSFSDKIKEMSTAQLVKEYRDEMSTLDGDWDWYQKEQVERELKNRKTKTDV